MRRSVLSPSVRIEGGAIVENAVLLSGVTVGPGAVVRNTIIDKNVDIPAGAQVGVDRVRDEARFTVSDRGTVAIAKGTDITERV